MKLSKNKKPKGPYGKLFAVALATFLFLPVITAQAEIDGKANLGAAVSEAAKVTASRIKNTYESHEFTLAPAASDVDLKVTQTAFTKVTRAHLIIIRTDGDISIKLNSTGDDVITLTGTEGQLVLTVTEVSNIFLSSTPGANVKIILS